LLQPKLSGWLQSEANRGMQYASVLLQAENGGTRGIQCVRQNVAVRCGTAYCATSVWHCRKRGSRCCSSEHMVRPCCAAAVTAAIASTTAASAHRRPSSAPRHQLLLTKRLGSAQKGKCQFHRRPLPGSVWQECLHQGLLCNVPCVLQDPHCTGLHSRPWDILEGKSLLIRRPCQPVCSV
jgi:hypothetical protein